jgi:hypothetical protein
MDAVTRESLDKIHSDDAQAQNDAYSYLMRVTEKPVDWAYEAWDGLVGDLRHRDNHVRAIAAQLMANLAKSDPDKRMLKDFEALLNVTKDSRFVTARHTMQSIWKVGMAGKEQRKLLLDGLARRFAECISEKNCTLIRFDIVQGLRNLYEEVNDESIRETAAALINTEEDIKYRKKYASVWRR